MQELSLPLTQALSILTSAPNSSVEEKGTVVTPRVGAIAKKLFCQPLHIVEMSGDNTNTVPQNIPSWRVHRGDPEVVQWEESVGDSSAIQAVILDGTTYRVCVTTTCFT